MKTKMDDENYHKMTIFFTLLSVKNNEKLIGSKSDKKLQYFSYDNKLHEIFVQSQIKKEKKKRRKTSP